MSSDPCEYCNGTGVEMDIVNDIPCNIRRCSCVMETENGVAVATVPVEAVLEGEALPTLGDKGRWDQRQIQKNQEIEVREMMKNAQSAYTNNLLDVAQQKQAGKRHLENAGKLLDAIFTQTMDFVTDEDKDDLSVNNPVAKSRSDAKKTQEGTMLRKQRLSKGFMKLLLDYQNACNRHGELPKVPGITGNMNFFGNVGGVLIPGGASSAPTESGDEADTPAKVTAAQRWERHKSANAT